MTALASPQFISWSFTYCTTFVAGYGQKLFFVYAFHLKSIRQSLFEFESYINR